MALYSHMRISKFHMQMQNVRWLTPFSSDYMRKYVSAPVYLEAFGNGHVACGMCS